MAKNVQKIVQEAIEAFVCGGDVFVALPTGFGKSPSPPIIFDWLEIWEKSIIVPDQRSGRRIFIKRNLCCIHLL